MISIRLTAIFLLLFFMETLGAGAASGQAAARGKYALIFAIGNYPAANGWAAIASLRDVGYLDKMLKGQGFSDDHIMVVADTQATMKGIANAFATLTARVQPGDVVVVHFSSHGEQVEADRDYRIDGLDECVVTINAKAPNRSTDYPKDQAEYLRGHVLGDYLRALRAKLGADGDLLVTMDDCHSGNGTRGMARVRGGAPPLVSVDFDPSRHRRSDSSMLSRDAAVYGAGTPLSPYVVFSATRPEELDDETDDEETGVAIGSLTYAVCKAFAGLSATTGYPSYRQLFASIQSIMNVKVPAQHPMMEGDGVDRLLFGGQFVHQLPYIEISSLDKPNHQIILKAGKTTGLDAGALVEICPAGTRDTTGVRALVRAKIISAGEISSVATFDGELPIDQPVDGWAFVTARVYNITPVTLQIRTGPHGYTVAEAAGIGKALQDMPEIRVVAKAPMLTLVKGTGKDTLKVSGNGYVFATVQPAGSGIGDLRSKLENYARYVFLQSLSCQLPGVQVEMRLFLRKSDGTADTAATLLRMKQGRFESHEGDSLTLWIRNNGTQLVYVNVLDLSPDGEIAAILPNMMHSRVKIGPEELALPPGREYWLPKPDLIRIGPPDGTEVFKLFASPEMINLENLANTRGGVDPSHRPTMMEQLIRMSYNGTRGGELTSANTPDAATTDYIFLIKPKP